MSLWRSLGVLLTLGALTACATTFEQAPSGERGRLTALELFHRARFRELARENPQVFDAFAYVLYTEAERNRTRTAEWRARASYRDGDTSGLERELAHLAPDNATRKVLEALLAHTRGNDRLRTTECTGILSVPLLPQALDRGYPVVSATIGEKKFLLLWDTGAGENVLGPAAIDALHLARSDVELTLDRGNGPMVIRASATATRDLRIGTWRIDNIPWLLADLESIRGMKRELEALDGFLSPQLLLPHGCFAIDRPHATLSVAFDAKNCRALVEGTGWRAPIYSADGEIYVSGRVHESPEVAVRVETGSPVSFLRSDASRYLPPLALGDSIEEGIAEQMSRPVSLSIAGREKALSAIDLQPRRRSNAYDDIATVGNDLLLQGRGVVVSFATMQIGTLDAGDPSMATR